MSRRFNERQRYWRSNLSQIARACLSLSFDYFIQLLVVCLVVYSSVYYLFLEVIYLFYIYHKYHRESILILLVGSFILTLIVLRPSQFKTTVRGEVKNVFYNGIQIDDYFIQTNQEYQLGDLIEATIEKGEFSSRARYNAFDSTNYLKGKGVRYYTYAKNISCYGRRFHLRNVLLEYVENHFDQEVKDLYLYLLLGEKQEGIEHLSDMASSLALLHVFAISGMHFTIIMNLLVKGLSFFMSEKHAAILSVGLMGIYAVCLEGNIAAWRSFLTLVLKSVGVKNDLQRYGLVGLFFLLVNPQIFFQMSFIYSMSLYFLVLVTKEIKYGNIFVYFGSMVITSYFQYELLPLGFFFGHLFSTIMAAVFPLFFIDLLTRGFFSSFCFYLYQGMLGLMEILCQIKWSVIIGKPQEWMVILFFITYVYALYRLNLRKEIRHFCLPLIVFCVMGCFHLCDPFGKVAMIDVGQGDCFLITFPYQKETILIDTGGLAYSDVAEEKVIPFLKYLGIKKIDYIYISHQDFDHCGALESLQSHFQVDEVIEDFEINNHQEAVFYQLNEKKYNNENDNSLVIYTQLGGLGYLFTGDISAEVEKELVQSYSDLEVDVLKVSHHGSRSSSCHEFLQWVTPTLSMISVGYNNTYGHPNKEVLSSLEAYGSQVYRSDQYGSFVIYFKENQSYIEME